MDAFHNPEFTTVELYQAYCDYFSLMDLVEDMYKTIAQNVCGTTDITYQGTKTQPGSALGKNDDETGGKKILRCGLRFMGFRRRCARLRKAVGRGSTGRGQGDKGSRTHRAVLTRSAKTSLYSLLLYTITPSKILPLQAQRGRPCVHTEIRIFYL